jgi:hypothetical protein
MGSLSLSTLLEFVPRSLSLILFLGVNLRVCQDLRVHIGSHPCLGIQLGLALPGMIHGRLDCRGSVVPIRFDQFAVIKGFLEEFHVRFWIAPGKGPHIFCGITKTSQASNVSTPRYFFQLGAVVSMSGALFQAAVHCECHSFQYIHICFFQRLHPLLQLAQFLLGLFLQDCVITLGTWIVGPALVSYARFDFVSGFPLG